MIIEALKLKGNVAAEHESRGIVYATHQKTPDSLATGYIAIDAGWCESEYFEGLLRGLGLSFVKSYQMERIYKTESHLWLEKISRELRTALDRIADYMEEAMAKRWGFFYGMELEHCQMFAHRGIGCAFAKAKSDACALDYVGYIGVQDIWFKNEGFGELLKGQGLEYVMMDYNIKVYKTQSNLPLHKIKRHLEMTADKIKDHIEGKEMAICKKK